MTGSISLSTRRTRSSRQSIRNVRLPATASQPRQRQEELHHRADQDPDRVRVDLVVLRQHRHEADQRGDDHGVPGHRRERRHAEVVERVEHADHEARQREQHHDREHQPREVHGQVLQRRVVVEARREHRHQRLGEDHEQRGERAEDQQDQEEQARGDPEGLVALAALEQLGEHRHEGALEGRVGHERADEVRHLEGDRERRHGAADPEVPGGHDLAHQARGRATSPVANEKKAVLRASRRASPRRSGASGSMGRALH